MDSTTTGYLCVGSTTDENLYTANDLFAIAVKKEKEIALQKEKELDILLDNTIVAQLPKLHQALFAAASEGKFCAKYVANVNLAIARKFESKIAAHLSERGFNCSYRVVHSQGVETTEFTILWKNPERWEDPADDD